MILTIQIVNYNSRENLERCLGSIEESLSGRKDIQVIVINNDVEKIGKFPGDLEVECIEKNENIGFGKAHNLGLRSARGKYVLFLNPDAKIFPETVENMLEAFGVDEKIGVVGPLHMDESGHSDEEHFGESKTPLTTIGTKLSREKKRIFAESFFETDWVSGGAMVARRDLLLDLGGFDENYFMYFEDVDLCLKAKKKGWKVVVHPKAKIWHKSGQSFSSSRQKKRYYYASQEYYVKKNFGPSWAWLVKAIRFPLYIKNVYFSK